MTTPNPAEYPNNEHCRRQSTGDQVENQQGLEAATSCEHFPNPVPAAWLVVGSSPSIFEPVLSFRTDAGGVGYELFLLLPDSLGK